MFNIQVQKFEMSHFFIHEYGHLQNPAEFSKTLVPFFNSDTAT